MSFIVKKIQSLQVQATSGTFTLSPKAGEDPEIKAFTDEIEDTDDGLTNDGQLIANVTRTRSHIQNVFGYNDDDVDKIKEVVNLAKTSADFEVPFYAVMTDGSIYSNKGVFVGPISYNGTGTIELKIACAKDWEIS